MKLIAMILMFLLSLSATAEIVKWTDKNGQFHFGDAREKPADAKAETVNTSINTYTGVSFESAGLNSNNVIMYSTSWCGYCEKARKHFAENRIAYVEYDIEKDPAASRRHKDMGAKGVPVILFKGKRMNGFNVSSFSRLYQPKP